MWMLVIGLVWLSVTGVACVLIGRAIRKADVRDEELALLERAAARRAAARGGPGFSGRRLILPPPPEDPSWPGSSLS